MTLSVHTRKLVETIERYPTLIKDEHIIDAISGVHVSAPINRPYLVPVFGMDGQVFGSAMGLALTPTRIILYYEDEATNHQFRAYPIGKIENITLEVTGLINKNNVVRLYMGGSFVTMKLQLGEGPEEFIKNVKNCMCPQPSSSNCENIIEGNFVYCMKCGEKLEK